MRYNHLLILEKLPLRQRIVVFTGAGISVESGLSTYRGADGLTSKYDYRWLSSASSFDENPAVVLEFHNMLRSRLLEVEPNQAHKLLVELEQFYDVTIVTQNVDNLHERAGSRNVVHLHGELSKVTSSRNRLDPACIKEFSLDVEIKLGDKAADGSQLRPYIVWFGEYLSNEAEVVNLIKNADILVVIGTSLTVYPAASFINYAHPEIPRFIIDPGELSANIPAGFTHIKEPATTGLKTLLNHLTTLLKN